MSYNKYGNTRTRIDGMLFDSILESKRYQELKLLKKAGEVIYFLRQPRFDLPGNIKYYADFLVVNKDGSIDIEDVKGCETPEFKLKKKATEALYPIEIKLIKKVR